MPLLSRWFPQPLTAAHEDWPQSGRIHLSSLAPLPLLILFCLCTLSLMSLAMILSARLQLLTSPHRSLVFPCRSGLEDF